MQQLHRQNSYLNKGNLLQRSGGVRIEAVDGPTGFVALQVGQTLYLNVIYIEEGNKREDLRVCEGIEGTG